MSGFLFAAGVLTLIAVGCVLWPLAKPGGATPRALPSAVLASVLVVAGAVGLYGLWSDWAWAPRDESAATPAQMIAKLARRLEREPEDLDGWLMLGRSYAVMEQYPLAVRSFQRADRLANGKNAEALIGMAEALTLENEAELDGRAGKLFEQALALEPTSGKALFFSAVSAYRRGELPKARERFESLLALDPPENVRPMLEQQIATIDQQLAGGGGAGTVPAVQQDESAVVRVSVRLSPDLAKAVKDGAPLFVMVRDPAAPGPPLAAKRLESRFPQDIELTPADSMLAGRSFRSGQSVEVVARVALAGTPTAQAGDPFGSLRYEVGRDGRREIVIDRLAP